MADLSVQEIEDDVYEKLSARAKAHGLSVEEEVRRIISKAVSAPERLGTLAVEIFGSEHGVELELAPRELHEPPDFRE